MDDFLRFFDDKKDDGPWKLDIYYSLILDWKISIEYKGNEIVRVQDCDMEFAFAKAHVLVKEWLIEHEGGF
ncbi:hypothetical protein P4H66_23500 [Paenibacillus dokdonensis]|uniref:Uncharacterized protein n=1 Tax=Paenibacillus dokdonensis TaxID=2567944 RepID=A0ABU6GSV5_9BACL|nr:hypothetical protein [Paenibacillus dokdonensis]MEC0242781.1 hypothetical protein [Paenibacillus dokdonensis]